MQQPHELASEDLRLDAPTRLSNYAFYIYRRLVSTGYRQLEMKEAVEDAQAVWLGNGQQRMDLEALSANQAIGKTRLCAN